MARLNEVMNKLCGTTLSLLNENENDRLTPETEMYRYCSDEEIGQVVNGGKSGKFWLNRPYYGTADQIYLKTTYGTLRTSHQASYQGGSIMTADGSLIGSDAYEIIHVHGQSIDTVSKEKYRWNVQPYPLEAYMFYRDNGETQAWTDDEDNPTIVVRFYRYDKSGVPFAVIQDDKFLQNFINYESAARFITIIKGKNH